MKSAGGKVQAIICDGNRTNQAFFKKFKTQENKLWTSEESTFLLHDYVHLLKSFRNLWLTERNGELEFVLNDEILVARWQDLRDLHHQERDSLVKMSMLNEVAVYSRVIERQRVQSCLNVFCGKTAASLQLYEEKCGKDVNGKVILIQTVCKWWKILNAEQKGLYMRFRYPLHPIKIIKKINLGSLTSSSY